MKKLLAIILALVISTSISTVFIACENESQTHSHTYSSEWTSDQTYHWHKATCEHTEEIFDKATHSYGSDGKCTACGNKEQAHTHTYSSEWTSDQTHHWHKATCEHTEEMTDKAEHTYGNDKKCTVCQKEKLIVYSVTETEWNQIFTLENVSNLKILVDIPVFELIDIYEIVEENIKYVYTEGSRYGEEIYAKTGENYICYYRRTQDGKFKEKLNYTNWLETNLETIDNTLDLLTGLKNNFSKATYSQTNKNYALTLATLSFILYDKDNKSYTNLSYTVTFEDIQIKSVEVSFFVEDYNSTITFNFSFGTANIIVPTSDMIETQA